MKNWNVKVLDKSLYIFFSAIMETILSSAKYIINIPNTIKCLGITNDSVFYPICKIFHMKLLSGQSATLMPILSAQTPLF